MRASLHAPTMTSGPTPAGSPIVIARSGFSSDIYFCHRGHGERGVFKRKNEGLRIRVSIVYRLSVSLSSFLFSVHSVSSVANFRGSRSQVAPVTIDRSRAGGSCGEVREGVPSHSTKDVSNFSHARIAVTP